MQIFKIQSAGFAANCYLVTEDGRNAVAIDPALPGVLQEAEKRGLRIGYVLLTHGHFDHIGGCAALQGEGAKIACLGAERPLLFGTDNLAAAAGVKIAPFTLDFCLSDGQEIELCDMKFRVIATPGHTAGGACYLCGRTLFTGDTLFEGSVGRVDFPTGDGEALEKSVRRLYALEGDFVVCPGHGENTTLARERSENGWIRA